jgi:ferredoxin
MDTNKINDRECIRCGDCRSVCNSNAICFFSKRKEDKLCKLDQKQPL